VIFRVFEVFGRFLGFLPILGQFVPVFLTCFWTFWPFLRKSEKKPENREFLIFF